MKVDKIGRLAAGALAVALVTASCSSERSGTDGVSGGDSGGGATAAASKTFGTLASPCGPGDAKGKTDQGVTDDAITIGFGDDRGFASAPGLSKEMGDAVSAMIEWCNQQGGINGRKIKGNQYDAAYAQSAKVMQESCKQDFMLVGQGFAMDEAAEQYRVACKLPTVAGYTVGPNAAMGPMKYEAVPYPVDMMNIGGLRLAEKLFPDFKDKTDLLLSTSPAVSTGTSKIAGAMKEIGIKPLECGVRLNDKGESSYMPFAEKIKKCGAGYLWSSDSPDPGQFSLLESIERAGAKPKYVFEATWYSTMVSKWNTSGAGDNLHVGMIFQPFENAEKVPAVKQYMDIVNAKQGKVALLGMQATSAFLLWAQSAQKCGSDLTRQCVINELAKVHEWTGGGLHAPTDPGNNKPASCSLMVKLNKTKYEQVYPKNVGEFECGPELVVKTDPKASGVTLNDDRISTKFLTGDVIKPQSS
ncbi:ABC-type branched-chain amino acid transport system, substrate-binding protein [Actinomadura meyerae]|uniref:ABC-type branched-chain amino acid transport system, substrate-binding protein n=1 Tax=Actinomadura meyerae TaxID=240840 RepID=A0A239NU03_9ACTN|nr:ABC transporter substrate-binding protein [Actinomadura meyerae]SNT58347.1 ABC-type branched-chain amino acid transport system, substrate-binding protein [Actinomadura meyerae]